MADLDAHLIDKRTQERNMRRGILDKQDFDKHLEGLKDVADNAEILELPMPGEHSGDEGSSQE